MGYDFGKIWVVGAKGRIGTMIRDALDMREVELFETDREELDITDENEVKLFGSRNRPNTIINCAGLTDAGLCEKNVEEAYRVNALGARNLSAIARKIDARIIQLSTDDIFFSETEQAFHEFDTPNPVTVYGKSKLAGENFVKELAPKHLIIRSSWVSGKSGNNFVNTVMEKLKKGETFQAAEDEYACPTSAREVSNVLLELVRQEQEGIYHAVCTGRCVSRYELAVKIAGLLGVSDKGIIPVKRETLRVGEKGSGYTVLDNLMLRMCRMKVPADWESALKEYIEDNR